MDYYINVCLIILVIIGVWTVLATPPKSILSKYPYFNLVLGMCLPSALSKININLKDLECINRFYFRYRIFCLYLLGSLIFFGGVSKFTADKKLIKMQEAVEKAERHLRTTVEPNMDCEE